MLIGGFRSVRAEEYEPLFSRIGNDWMLIGATDGERANIMTASWGGFGYVWNRPIAICLIRPERYTCPLAERGDRISISFLDEAYRQALIFCGRHSGREGDKFEGAGLHCVWRDGTPYPAEASSVLLCRKLYAGDLRREGFADGALLQAHYGEGNLHRLFFCEIEEVLLKHRAAERTS